MKITKTDNASFKPFTLHIEVETLEEARVLRALGNWHGRFADAVAEAAEVDPKLVDNVLKSFYSPLEDIPKY